MRNRYGILMAGLIFCCSSLFIACGKNDSKTEKTDNDVVVKENEQQVQVEEEEPEVTQEEAVTIDVADKSQLKGFLNIVKNQDASPYSNPEILEEPIAKAEAVIADTNASQEEADAAYKGLKGGN